MRAVNTISQLRLSKAQRLKTPADYRSVYQSKQWGASQHHRFNILADAEIALEEQQHAVSPVDGDYSSVLGVTVSKKVSKLAVVRNQIKRQVKEFFRLRQHQLFGVQLVITAKPSCAKASSTERHQSLELLWQKIRKWQRWYTATHK